MKRTSATPAGPSTSTGQSARAAETAGGAPAVPIFDTLVDERGDVLTEAREAARATQEEAAAALDWSDLDTERNGGG